MSDQTRRLQTVVDDLRQSVDEVILRHRVSMEELLGVVGWVERTVAAGELPLATILFTKAVLQAADGATYAHPPQDGASSWEMEGPAHLPEAPVLHSPAVLPMRENEPGDPLLVRGTVRATSGQPIPGAVLDVWQIDAENVYSGMAPEDFALFGILPHITNDATDVPRDNLRGRVVADESGGFEFRTVMPGVESFGFAPRSPLADLAEALEQPGDRPRHIHLIVTADGFLPLTTQIYFEDDPLVRSAIEGRIPEDAVKAVTRYGDQTDAAVSSPPTLMVTSDFVLRPEVADE